VIAESATAPGSPDPASEPRNAAPADPPARADTTRRAGRGGLAIASAKLFFIVAGFVQQIALNRILGLNLYGTLGRVQGIGSVFYNPVVTASIQGVSRAVAAAPEAERAVATRRALVIHAAAIVPLAVGFFLATPIAGQLLHAPHLVTPLRVITGVLFLYGLYAPLVGVLNGRHQFGRQAALDVLFATMRTVGLIGGAWLFVSRGLGVEAALAGFVGAALLILFAALGWAGIGRSGPGRPTVREHLRFIGPLFAGQFALNLLFQSDLQLLGTFAAHAAERVSLDPRQADTLAGAYRNAQLFCFLPYQLLLSVTFVLFPMLAEALRDNDRPAVARYVRTGVRLALVLAGLMVSVTAGLPGPLLRLVFGPESAALGTDGMRILALGLGAFAIFGILTTVLTSLKREVAGALLTIAALALVAGLCFVLVDGQPYGAGMIVRTATSTAIGLVAATVLAAWLVYRTVGAVAPLATLVRVLLALGAAFGLSFVLPAPGKLMTLAYVAAIPCVYLAVLVGTRELGRADLALVRTVFRRKG
jgi:stage V sporulation protein B